ncbi:3D domain-containing protein [bacterium]|nr:3D domain-containing protein [bacterium]
MSIFRKAIFGIFLLFIVIGAALPFIGRALADEEKPIMNSIKTLPKEENIVVQNNTVLSNTAHYYNKPTAKISVVVTGYSSDPLETDDTPFITASGTFVREGVIATNFLPFGTKIRIPSLFGEEIFVVEDRMNPRKKFQIDVWFPTKEEAINFGVHKTYIEVLEQ